MGLVIVVAILAVRNRQALPVLTAETFDAARARWDDSGPRNYVVEVAVTGRQSATYRVEVRDGAAVAATRNGEPLRQRRTMDTWSVAGMFSTIHSDVINLERVRTGTADAQTPQVRLRCLFHEQFGYPQRYHRTEFRKFGPNEELMWEVQRFEVVE